MSSHSSEMEGPLIVPTMHTEDMDSPHWQERSVFVGGLPETHRAGPVVFNMVRALGQVTSIRNGSSGALNPHFTIIGFQTSRHARAAAEYLKVPGPLVPAGLQPSAVTLDHVDFARQRVGRPFFPPGAPIPSLGGPRPPPPYAAPRYASPNSVPMSPWTGNGGGPAVNGGQALRPYGVGGVGNGFGSGNGHGHSASAGGPAHPTPWDSHAAPAYGREMSPVGASRGGMRSDTYPAVPSRSLPNSRSGEVGIARTASPALSSGSSMRAFPPSPVKGAYPELSPRPASPPDDMLVGQSPARVGPPAPLPPSLFTPPTSAADLAAKLELAQKTLRELDAHARRADQQADQAKRTAEMKEAEQEKELVVLRRELEAAKRSAVEMQLKANATAKLVERLSKDDDKIGLSLSLLENLAHRARVAPGPAGALPPVPAGYDVSHLSSAPTVVVPPSSSPSSASAPGASPPAAPIAASIAGIKRPQEDRLSSGRPNAKQRRLTSSELMDDPPTSAISGPSAPIFTAEDGEKMVREAARRQAEMQEGLLSKVGKAFSFFSGPSTPAAD